MLNKLDKACLISKKLEDLLNNDICIKLIILIFL